MIEGLLTFLAGAGVLGFIEFLIKRKDSRHDDLVAINIRLDKIDKNQIKNEKDSCRTQMLLLMSDYPDEKAELLRIAEHYFVDLNGDWYMTDLFSKWLDAKGIERPKWFKGGK